MIMDLSGNRKCASKREDGEKRAREKEKEKKKEVDSKHFH